MSIFGVLTNANIYFGGYDLTCVSNQIDPNVTVADKDTTTFCSNGANTRTGGLVDFAATVDGFAETGSGLEDDTLWSSFAGNTHILTVSPTGADGTIAYTVPVLQTNYRLAAKVGEVFGFHQETKNRLVAPVSGTVLMPKQTATSTTSGTVTNLGAVSATQSVYASLHVFSASGTTPTLDVTVRSSAVLGFTSPTTRLTFNQMTAVGDQWQSAAGAISNGYWRVTATIAGTTPSFSFAVVVGIQ